MTEKRGRLLDLGAGRGLEAGDVFETTVAACEAG
jgi:hypothetical protein